MAGKNGTLTLTRSSGESLLITTEFGEQLEIMLHTFSGKQCKVSINAPRGVNVVRSELLELKSEVTTIT